MTPLESAELALALLRGARLITSQLTMADMEEVPPEMRAELKATRDEVNARFDSLMPNS